MMVQSMTCRVMPRLITLGRKRLRPSLSSLTFLDPQEGRSSRTDNSSGSISTFSANLRRNFSSGSRNVNVRNSNSTNKINNNNNDNGTSMKIYDSLSSSYRTFPHPQNNSTSINQSSQSVLNNDDDFARGTAWYVCGPTVYDSSHLGHGRTYVALDILRRVALHLHNGNSNGNNIHNSNARLTPRPMYVMNITDVDDKIIQRSMENMQKGSNNNEEAEADPILLARKYEAEFWQDMDALNVLRPDVICRVSEHVDFTIVPYIDEILKGGMAYVIPEHGNNDDQEHHCGSVYFDVRAFESKAGGKTKYGKLAPDAASTEFFSWEDSNNGDNDEGEKGSVVRRKRDPRDFCLWKYRPRNQTSKETNDTATIVEPASVSYPSPWGPGRPGWHVECSAMISKLSKDFQHTHEFGVHCGGVDLKFPHHSNEIAQSEAHNFAMANNNGDDGDNNGDSGDFKEWIPHWIHTGHLHVKGRKMSKSLKNFITIREMLGASNGDEETNLDHQHGNNAWHSPADDFRLWVLGLSGHYRGPATFSQDRMDEARVIREKWIKFLMEGQECFERLKSKNHGDDLSSSNRLWGEEEMGLFNSATACSINCSRAMLNDSDGMSFVKELNHLAESGMTYVERAKKGGQSYNNPPEEPLRFVLNTFRSQLDLVGFTSRTVNAGIISISTTQGEGSSSTTSSSLNTAVVLDEAVAFRAKVRSAAINALRNKNNDDGGQSSLDAAKEILGLCDEMRNDTFPKVGVEILDGKVVEESSSSDGANRGWRYCSPRESNMTNKKP